MTPGALRPTAHDCVSRDASAAGCCVADDAWMKRPAALRPWPDPHFAPFSYSYSEKRYSYSYSKPPHGFEYEYHPAD